MAQLRPAERKDVPQDTRPLYDRAKESGFNIYRQRTGKRHLVWTTRDNRFVSTSATTPSDFRGMRNLRAKLRRAGLEV
jgi:hypothetical protein